MNAPPIDIASLPRPVAFKAATIVFITLNMIGVALGALMPQTAQDMMVPWARTANMLICAVTASAMMMIWYRKSWGVYLLLTAQVCGLLVGAITGTHWILLLVGLALVLAYYSTLFAGGAYSIWRQMFGGVGQLRRGTPYGMQPAPPPMPPRAAAAPRPAAPVAAPAVAPAVTPAASKVPPRTDALETITKLATLRDAGLITPQEFDAKKAELLKQI